MGDKFNPVKITDFESDWYVIPNELFDDFIRLVNHYYNAQPAQKYDMEEEFEEKYGKYRTGGGLNLIQFYVKETI